MDSRETAEAFASLSTPALADACLRIGLAPRLAPPGLRPLRGGWRAAGRAQARRVREGRRLSEQFRFAEFLEGRAARPGLTFREHLKAVGGAIEV